MIPKTHAGKLALALCEEIRERHHSNASEYSPLENELLDSLNVFISEIEQSPRRSAENHPNAADWAWLTR